MPGSTRTSPDHHGCLCICGGCDLRLKLPHRSFRGHETGRIPGPRPHASHTCARRIADTPVHGPFGPEISADRPLCPAPAHDDDQRMRGREGQE
ncbi:protein of unknown function [Streptomyces murinus]